MLRHVSGLYKLLVELSVGALQLRDVFRCNLDAFWDWTVAPGPSNFLIPPERASKRTGFVQRWRL